MRPRYTFMIAVAFMVFAVLLSCSRRSPKATAAGTAENNVTPEGTVMADTIIYEVPISNPNPDDLWTTKCLSRLNRKALVDSIFAMVIDKRAIAYNQETNERLTRKQVEEIESAKGYSRDNIGMIQFTEAWYLNPGKNTMTKKVLSMVLGYNFYTSDGELFGHKPVLRVVMNK